jgi:hypothetical protein
MIWETDPNLYFVDYTPENTVPLFLDSGLRLKKNTGYESELISIPLDTGRQTGKYYFEITRGAADIYTTTRVGIILESRRNTYIEGGSAEGGAMWWRLGDGVTTVRNYTDADETGYASEAAPTAEYWTDVYPEIGNTIGIALDLDNARLFIRTEDVGWIDGSDPVAGTNPFFYNFSQMQKWYPFVYSYTNQCDVVINLGGSAFVYTVPTGYSAYNDESTLISPVLPTAEVNPAADMDIQLQMVIPTAEINVSATISVATSFNTGDAVLRYYLTITGSADNTTDIEIPMSSFQARRRSGAPTYLSAVIPSVDYIDYITARSNGTIRIDQGYEKNGVILQREKIIETTIDRADTYKGSVNASIVLVGYTTTTFSPKTVDLIGSILRSYINGKINVRLARPYIFLNPGDTINIDDDTFIVGNMAYAISDKILQLDIQEA